MSSAVRMEPAEPESLVGMLRRQAREAPDEDAFVWLEEGEREGERVTFACLDAKARGIAGLLAGRRLGGRPVLLSYPPGLELIAAFFGCLYAGSIAVIVPRTARRSANRVRSIAADSSAQVVLTVSGSLSEVEDEVGASHDLQVLPTDFPGACPDEADSIAGDAQSIAMLQYTSGSTASPRGVMLSHANVLANLRAMARVAGLKAGETAAGWLPLQHDMGLMGLVLFPIYAGLRCVLMAPLAFAKRPSRWVEAIGRYRATMSAAPCFAYDLAVRASTASQRSALDLSCWRIAVCGGEIVRAEALDRFVEAFAPARFRPEALVAAYGLAEATVFATSTPAGCRPAVRSVDRPELAAGRATVPASAERARRLVSCGHPWEGSELIVVDPERRTTLPAGRVGEIWLRSACVARGYWRYPLDSAATFGATLAHDDPSGAWLRTGDLGFMCEDGLMVTGRRKDMIVVRGANVDPLDLEIAAGNSHPALLPGGGGAFSFNDERGEHVVLVHEVDRAAIGDIDYASVTERVAGEMTRGFGLALYDLVLLRPGALPRTTSGKVQRHLCRERYMGGGLARLCDLHHPALVRWRPMPP